MELGGPTVTPPLPSPEGAQQQEPRATPWVTMAPFSEP